MIFSVLVSLLCVTSLHATEAYTSSAPPPPAANDNWPSAPEQGATGIQPNNGSESLLQRTLSACQDELANTARTCKPKAVGSGAGQDVSGLSAHKIAKANSKLMEGIANEAEAQIKTCRESATSCHRRCGELRIQFISECTGESCLSDSARFDREMQSCFAQYSRQRPVHQAKDEADEARKESDTIAQQSGDQQSTRPSKGDGEITAGGSRGGGLYDGSYGGGSSGGGDSLPVGNVSTIPGQNSANGMTPASTSNTGNNAGANQARAQGDAMPETSTNRWAQSQGLPQGMMGLPSTGMNSNLAHAQRLYQALTGGDGKKSGATSATKSTATQTDSSYAPTARGQGAFVNGSAARGQVVGSGNTGLRRDSTGAWVQAPIANRGAPSAGATNTPVAQVPNEGWTTAESQALGTRRAPASADTNYAELNDRLRMQRGDTPSGAGTGGAIRPAGSAGANIPLSEYLPNGSHYQGARGTAGASARANGIQSQHTDIWGLISKRMRSACLDGRLRDCR
ncbi:MAG: hypothetical protein KF799_06415 [Bdellovibrionales bacterium]|nr:hypothetical protein [Bdellovibrionales bacterium]